MGRLRAKLGRRERQALEEQFEELLLRLEGGATLVSSRRIRSTKTEMTNLLRETLSEHVPPLVHELLEDDAGGLSDGQVDPVREHDPSKCCPSICKPKQK